MSGRHGEVCMMKLNHTQRGESFFARHRRLGRFFLAVREVTRCNKGQSKEVALGRASAREKVLDKPREKC